MKYGTVRALTGMTLITALTVTSACNERRYDYRTESEWRDELRSSDERRRLWAAGALAAMDAKSDETRHALVNALEDTSASVRIAVAKALSERHEGRTLRGYILGILWRTAVDSTSETRVSALEALGLEPYHDARSLPILIAALRDPSAATRATAAVSIGMFRYKARPAESALQALMQDSSEVVRHEARDALTAITGRKYEH